MISPNTTNKKKRKKPRKKNPVENSGLESSYRTLIGGYAGRALYNCEIFLAKKNLVEKKGIKSPSIKGDIGSRIHKKRVNFSRGENAS